MPAENTGGSSRGERGASTKILSKTLVRGFGAKSVEEEDIILRATKGDRL
jgi:hypothetical protein